ncbi:hypothetical protein L2E82_06539 [Cichorium intybus]|uniref:Uncharacterized protein n=1 Tax=Cichorium intybus TaxID=13427 RepID=A0ACB9HAA9_CICIN|nr:hypothetical protein L2E82_06539 [Cichorium intybus]
MRFCSSFFFFYVNKTLTSQLLTIGKDCIKFLFIIYLFAIHFTAKLIISSSRKRKRVLADEKHDRKGYRD